MGPHYLINKVIIMPLQVSQIPSDIYIKPIEIINSRSQKLSIGDLHANAMLLTFALVKHGVATIADEHYIKLVNIYQKLEELIPSPKSRFVRVNFPEMLPEEDKVEIATYLARFKEIWSQEITIDPTAITSLELVGDEKADRGVLDYFIDIIVKKLVDSSLPVDILLSNHGGDAISSFEYESQLSSHDATPVVFDGVTCGFEYPYARSQACDIQGFQRISAIRLGYLISQGLIDKKEVQDLYQNVYKKCLVAINYSIVQIEGKDTLIISTHAPIGLNDIRSLARKFNVEYNDSTIIGLATTIDRINEEFKVHMEFDTLSLLRPSAKTLRAEESSDPLEKLMWLRKVNNDDRPESHKRYHIQYIHGHTNIRPNEAKPHSHNLDGPLGKSTNLHSGTYHFLLSPEDMNPKSRAHQVPICTFMLEFANLIRQGKIDQVQQQHYVLLLQYAVHISDINIIRELLGKKSDILLNYSNGPFRGYNAIELAAFYGKSEIMETLLSTLSSETVQFSQKELIKALCLSLHKSHFETCKIIARYITNEEIKRGITDLLAQEPSDRIKYIENALRQKRYNFVVIALVDLFYDITDITSEKDRIALLQCAIENENLMAISIIEKEVISKEKLSQSCKDLLLQQLLDAGMVHRACALLEQGADHKKLSSQNKTILFLCLMQSKRLYKALSIVESSNID